MALGWDWGQRGIAMTEQEWLEYTDPLPMLEFVKGKASDRKLRLFAVACCRRIWYHDQQHEHGDGINSAIVTGESFADGLIGKKALRRAASLIGGVGAYSSMASRANVKGAILEEAAFNTAVGAVKHAGDFFAFIAIHDWFTLDNRVIFRAARESESGTQSAILRDIFANPFHPKPTLDPAILHWNDGTIPKMVGAIYQGRAFDQLPILADALEEAGCVDNKVLAHCRQPSIHVRGCWVVDLVLGKE
jgi:hypothetical protein